MKLSSLSKTPPWSLSKFDESFTPAERFINDSARSPNCADMLIKTPSEKISAGLKKFMENNFAKKTVIMDAQTDAIAPSTDFLGLIEDNRRLPYTEPKKYAAESATQTVTRRSMVSLKPSGRKSLISKKCPGSHPR